MPTDPKIITTPPEITDSDIIKTLNSNHLYNREQIERYTKFSRFGYLDLYTSNTISREYLFLPREIGKATINIPLEAKDKAQSRQFIDEKEK